MLALQREKRATAGNKMSKLLEAEDEDDFYKTTYGGFDEEECDNDYNSSQSDSDDVIDSDFSIDENDEMKSDDEEEGRPKKKRKGVVTKAYKDPKGDKATEKKPSAVKPRKEKPKQSLFTLDISTEKKSMRRSTTLKSEAALSRQKLDLQKDKILKDMAVKKNVASIRRMTQEELLEEAKVTEIQNLKSLENYQKLELEKKRARVVKQAYQGPVIRYHSLTMPLIDELPCEPEVDVDSEEVAEVKKPELSQEEKCERTFITFTDETTFSKIFPQKRLKPSGKVVCPVTKLPAKYFDPITQTPFANAQAFRCIREAYAKQLESEKKSRSSSPVQSQGGQTRKREKPGAAASLASNVTS